MQAKVIAISNIKGGVGKSTTAAILGVGLTQQGFRVLLIDSDPQNNLTMCFRSEPEDGERSLYDVYCGRMTLEQVLSPVCFGLDLIPCDYEMATADMEFKGLSAFRILARAIEKIRGDYDYIIIDTPPNAGILGYNALMAADYVVVPVAADRFSSRGTRLLRRIIDEVNEERQIPLQVAGILITRYAGRTNASKAMEQPLQKAAEMLGTSLFESRIRQAVAVQESQIAKVNLLDYAPRSTAAQDYINFVNEFVNNTKGE